MAARQYRLQADDRHNCPSLVLLKYHAGLSMEVNLLERGSYLQALNDVLFRVKDGLGRVIRVSGKASIPDPGPTADTFGGGNEPSHFLPHCRTTYLNRSLDL